MYLLRYVILISYLFTYLHTYLLTYLLTYSLTYWNTYLLTYSLIYLLKYLLAYLLTYILSTYILTYILTWIFTLLLTYVRKYILIHLLTYLINYIHRYLLIYLLTYGSFHVKWSNFRKNPRSKILDFDKNLYISKSWCETNFLGIFWFNSQYIVRYRLKHQLNFGECGNSSNKWPFLNPLKKIVNEARGLTMYVHVQLFTVFLVTLKKISIKLNFIWYTVAKMALKIEFQKLCIFLKHHISVRKTGTCLEFIHMIKHILIDF